MSQETAEISVQEAKESRNRIWFWYHRFRIEKSKIVRTCVLRGRIDVPDEYAEKLHTFGNVVENVPIGQGVNNGIHQADF
jgi:hypothetical protein